MKHISNSNDLYQAIISEGAFYQLNRRMLNKSPVQLLQNKSNDLPCISKAKSHDNNSDQPDGVLFHYGHGGRNRTWGHTICLKRLIYRYVGQPRNEQHQSRQ